MCGITGIFNRKNGYVNEQVLLSMTNALAHRGPDQMNYVVTGNVGLGFQRLSIIDLLNGRQPFTDEERGIRVICNGEIYNYRELRAELTKKGYQFRTTCDVEVLLPMYLEYGPAFLSRLNGQFAIAISDEQKGCLLIARDHVGICPLFYTQAGDVFLFGSEIKAILRYPGVKKEVDLTGLDQVFSFPGLVSPSTMFRNIRSLKPGSYLLVTADSVSISTFWDLNYPVEDHIYERHPESYYTDRLEELLLKSVKYRLNADVPLGFYLSGGLDSSLIGALMKQINPGTAYNAFSICFPQQENKEIDEGKYQRLTAAHLGFPHIQIPFSWDNIYDQMNKMIYYAECPVKETYNICSIALSKAVSERNIRVILSGEGADEFFGGYVGYRFDVHRKHLEEKYTLEAMLEKQENNYLWGDPDFFYEKNYHEFGQLRQTLYAAPLQEKFNEFNACRHLDIDKSLLSGRAGLHKRSYLDMKLRLSDHLLADHCDRTCYANGIEGRYPFLDPDIIEFVRWMPPSLKLNELIEKYVLRKIGSKYLPEAVYTRQKQGFVAPGSPFLLKTAPEWTNDMLSYDLIKRQGYFDPDVIERMKKLYGRDDFRLNLPFDNDLLITVLTFNIFLDVFDMPDCAY